MGLELGIRISLFDVLLSCIPISSFRIQSMVNKNVLWQGRVPQFLPAWLRRRIEVNVLCQIDLMKQAQAAFDSTAYVLDAGAGEGRFKRFLKHAHYVAVDIGAGDQNWDYGGLDCISDLHSLPFPDHTFDGVVCMQVLEHVRYPERVIQELARVLKRGGQLFLSAPQSWYQHQKPHDYFRFTSFSLNAMFLDAHLEPLFIRPMGGYFWALSFELQMMHHWLFPTDEDCQRRRLFPLLGSFFVRIPFLFLLPLPLYYLDRLDRSKDKTLGYVCRCIRS